jgi:2-desacetyl-2-hydroxyethyl bacteriochlorophyllide A dehydrogenase
VEDVRVEDIPKPAPRPGEALIRILYSGICGSDLHIYKKGMFVTYLPETMGHEFVGEIVEANGGDFEPGQLVVGDPRVPCLKCSACASGDHQRCVELGFIGEVSQGCFTEYLAMPWDKLVGLKKIAKTEYGALVEPLAVAYHICQAAAFGLNDNLAVFGCGPIGLLTIALAKKVFGVKSVTAVDIAEARLEKARLAGADHHLKNIGDSRYKEFDKAVEAAGIGPTFQAALECLKPGGLLAMVGIFENPATIDPNSLIGKELKVCGCNAYTREDLEKAAEIVGGERLDLSFVISRIIPFDQAPEAFEALSGKNKADLKILFKSDH